MHYKLRPFRGHPLPYPHTVISMDDSPTPHPRVVAGCDDVIAVDEEWHA